MQSQILPQGYTNDPAAAFQRMQQKARLDGDDLKVLALLEVSGESFYRTISQSVANAAVRQLLLRNGQEERGHAHRMLKALRLLTGEDYALPPDEQNPFIQSMHAAAPQIAATDAFLAGLAAGERQGEGIYGRWADGEPNAEVAKLYRQTGSEERMHAERLEDARKLLASGGP